MILRIQVYLLVAATLLSTGQCRKSTTNVKVEEEVYDTVTIEHDGPIRRNKRSTDSELPHTMFFNINSEKTNMKLRLKRAPERNLPVYLNENGKITQINVPLYQRHGIYLDHDTGKPLMVSDRGGYYDLEGSVLINGDVVNLRPEGRGRHRLLSGGVMDFSKDVLNGDGTGTSPKVSLRKAARGVRRQLRRNRNKRQTTNYVSEVLVVTDPSVRQKFAARNGGSTTIGDSELATYYQLILLGMSVKYESVSNFYPQLRFSVEGSGIIITATRNDAPFYRDNERNGLVQYDSGLNDFTTWVNQNRNALPPHDHAMWFTDERLASGQSTSVIAKRKPKMAYKCLGEKGVAWINGVCNNLGTSIVEDYYSGTTTSIAAHELGHSLTAYHDGDFAECSDFDYFVMAARSFIPVGTNRNNPWIFSRCSAVYMAYYAPRTHRCLLTNDNGIVYGTNEIAGQYLDADEQCRLRYASTNSYFCRNTQRTQLGFDGLCNRLYCYDPSTRRCDYTAPLDFTSCGNGRWCEKGSCVTSTSAPATSPNCPQGDSPVANCVAANCGSYNSNQLTDCCETCDPNNQVSPTTPPPPPTTPAPPPPPPTTQPPPPPSPTTQPPPPPSPTTPPPPPPSPTTPPPPPPSPTTPPPTTPPRQAPCGSNTLCIWCRARPQRLSYPFCAPYR